MQDNKDKYVDNEAKGRISKRLFQEKKARQIFPKTNISYPLIPTSACAYQRVRKVRFSENKSKDNAGQLGLYTPRKCVKKFCLSSILELKSKNKKLESNEISKKGK